MMLSEERNAMVNEEAIAQEKLREIAAKQRAIDAEKAEPQRHESSFAMPTATEVATPAGFMHLLMSMNEQ